jgi:Tol biopolymer transport system component
LEGLYSLPVAEWSPNGHYIAVHLSDGWMIYPTDCLFVLKTCEPVPVKPALQDNRIAWGPDGTTIASYATTHNVSTTIQTSGCWQGDSPCLEKNVILSDFTLLTEIAWSADGSRMAFSDYVQNGLVWLDTSCFDKAEGCEADLHTVAVGANRIAWPSISDDGRYILLMSDTSGNGTSQQLFIVDLESGEQRQITSRPGTAEYPDWSADRRYVLFSGFETARSGDLELYLLDLQRQMTLPIMKHNGRDLAFASWGYLPKTENP